jgi:hypothetical protein
MTRRRQAAAQSVPGVQLSDRAMLRLLALSGVDIDAIRAGIERALARAHAAVEAIGGGDHLITVAGLTFVVRGDTITTVMEAAPPSHQFARLTELRQP